MGNYFIYIIALLFTVAFSSFLSYDTEKARASRTALGVIMLVALTALCFDVLADLQSFSFSDVPEYNASEGESFTEQSLSDAFAEGVKLAITDRFSFSEQDVEVSCIGFDVNSVSAERICVSLSGRAAFADVRAVREYVKKLRLGECEVTVLFE